MNTKYFYNFSSKHPLLTSLLLFAMLLLSSVAQGQAQHASVTVGNGQESNQYVPIYGFYCDDYLRCQILYSASGMVTVSATETISHIELFNANGSLVRGIDCSDSVVSMDLDDLPAGIYMMAVRTSRGIVNKRVIVK